MTVGLSDYIHIFAIVVRPSGVERPADVLKIDVHAEFGTFAVTDVIYAGLLLVDAIGRLNAAEHGNPQSELGYIAPGSLFCIRWGMSDLRLMEKVSHVIWDTGGNVRVDK